MRTTNDQAHKPLSIAIEDPYCPTSVLLIERLWAEFGDLYDKNRGPCMFRPADIAGPGCAFVVARRQGEPVGCGAIRPFDPEGDLTVAEVKRMFVERHARRQGVARRILAELETIARAMGYTTVRLETGVRQPESIRLYETAGYHRIDCYGPYASDPLSICFEKQIA